MKNQVKQITNLKGEINSLNNRINSFITNNETLKKKNASLEDLKISLHEHINSKSIELEETTNKFNKIIAEKEKKAKSWSDIAIILGIAFIIAFIAYICK